MCCVLSTTEDAPKREVGQRGRGPISARLTFSFTERTNGSLQIQSISIGVRTMLRTCPASTGLMHNRCCKAFR